MKRTYSFCSVGFETGKDDPTPLKKGHVRLYEFLHGYEDVTVEEYDRICHGGTPEEKELANMLTDEINKEINREIIRTICEKATEQ